MNVGSLLDYLTVFVLAILLGFEVISKVPATLHTPLMSGTNSIHGIVLVGAIGLAATAVECMKAGSIIVDMAASDLGGNCELSKPGKVTITPNGVAIHAPLNLPASMPTGASAFYSRNILNLLLNFVTLGELRFDFEDEVTAATVITYGGKVVQEATRKLLQAASRGGAKA
jgi:NAD/NADP transhydrogenase alpha subunit